MVEHLSPPDELYDILPAMKMAGLLTKSRAGGMQLMWFDLPYVFSRSL